MSKSITFTCDSCGKIQEGQKRRSHLRVRRYRVGMVPPRWEKVFIFDQAYDLCPSCIQQMVAWIKKDS